MCIVKWYILKRKSSATVYIKYFSAIVNLRLFSINIQKIRCLFHLLHVKINTWRKRQKKKVASRSFRPFEASNYFPLTIESASRPFRHTTSNVVTNALWDTFDILGSCDMMPFNTWADTKASFKAYSYLWQFNKQIAQNT